MVPQLLMLVVGFGVLGFFLVQMIRRRDIVEADPAPDADENPDRASQALATLMEDPDRAVYFRLVRGGQILGAAEVHALRAKIDRETAIAEMSRLFLGQAGEPPLMPPLKPDVQEKIAALLKAGDREGAQRAYREGTGGDAIAARLAVDQLKASL
jgi:hypothetical protein